MKAFILLSIVAVAFATQQCGENEHYTNCGTDCPLTCENYNKPPEICNLMCRIGCECDDGFVRAPNGKCIRSFQCPQNATQCGENQHFTTCGTDCPLTCNNYRNPPKVCNLMCRIGCECDKGFVLTPEGKCVRDFQCPQNATQCGENQHYATCGTDCPLTCDNYRNPPKVCNLMCRIGCECDEGFVLTSEGKCVRSFQCPQSTTQCGKNQHYTTCGTDCPLTCDNYRNPPQICNMMCRIGCECDKGFVLTPQGKCIRSAQCPQEVRPIKKTCDEIADPGMCMGYFPMWFYDAKSGSCKKFIYGGCQGNGNRYAKEEECVSSCQGVKQSSSGACDMPADSGVCRGYFSRYYYDVPTGKCRMFVYGGCGGNENNFETIEECQRNCDLQRAPQACLQDKEVGPCRGSFIRFYFNKDTGKCEKFIYGGCYGNSNNFNSQEECEEVCSS